MKLSDEWFTSLSGDGEEQMTILCGRDELDEFRKSGKMNERVEISWKYQADPKGMPSDETAQQMEVVQEALRRSMEKDKLAILTGIYTGEGERLWVFYTRSVRVFGERLNDALASMDALPISIYTEKDPDWEEYLDLYEIKNP